MRINIDHTSITVRNLIRSIEFYRDILGMELLYVYEDGGPVAEGLKLSGEQLRTASLKFDECEIELFEFSNGDREPYTSKPKQIGTAHIGFKVDNILEWYEMLIEKGIDFWTSIMEIPDGQFKGWKFVYFTDPDGILLELVQAA
jgi:catechol 2,3-dioxygenase-like lactoylglutathione lyase family enzyme